MTHSPYRRFSSIPEKQGAYDPERERDACGLAMVATLRGTAGHDIIQNALDALRNLEHRGAVGSDAGTGDGAGILTQIPDAFFRAVVPFTLPEAGAYAVGAAFLPTDAAERAREKSGIEAIAAEEGLTVLGWREVPVDPSQVGTLAREAMPAIEQLFLASSRADATGAPRAQERGILAIGNVIDTQADYPETVVASALWHFEPTLNAALERVRAGTFVADNYGVYSFMKEGGSSLAPLGTFEGKVPEAAMKLVAEREAAIKAGTFTVAIDDSEPKSS